jgi:transposase
MMKLKQKISGGFRTLAGAQMFSRIRGYISTLKKQGLPVLESLKQVFLGNPARPTPLQPE